MARKKKFTRMIRSRVTIHAQPFQQQQHNGKVVGAGQFVYPKAGCKDFSSTLKGLLHFVENLNKKQRHVHTHIFQARVGGGI